MNPKQPTPLDLCDELHQVHCQLQALAHALPRFYEDGVDAEVGAGLDWLFDGVLTHLNALIAHVHALPETTVTPEYLDLRKQAQDILQRRQTLAVS